MTGRPISPLILHYLESYDVSVEDYFNGHAPKLVMVG
jgi:hypothetical protein